MLARAAETRMPDLALVLTEELERAHVLADVRSGHSVGMGSEVEFRDDTTGKVQTLTLVYPGDADIAQGRVSVPADPVGVIRALASGQQSDDFPLGPDPNINDGSLRVRRAVPRADHDHDHDQRWRGWWWRGRGRRRRLQFDRAQREPGVADGPAGATATWTVSVTNTGGAYLYAVSLADALAPNCNTPSAYSDTLYFMAPHLTVTYTCTLADVTGSFTDTLVAEATTVLGPKIGTSATAAVTVEAAAPVPSPVVQKPASGAKQRFATLTISGEKWHLLGTKPKLSLTVKISKPPRSCSPSWRSVVKSSRSGSSARKAAPTSSRSSCRSERATRESTPCASLKPAGANQRHSRSRFAHRPALP